MGTAVKGERIDTALNSYLREAILVESRITRALERVPSDRSGHAAMATMLGRLRSLADQHRAAFGSHDSKGTIGTPAGGGAFSAFIPEEDTAGSEHVPLSGAVRSLYGLLNEATFAYTALHAAAHRAFDSRGEGNTAARAEQHLRDYVGVVRGMARVASDLIVWELNELGRECRCQCPSCGLGICLCSPHGTITSDEAWREVSPVAAGSADRGIRVRKPRSESAAAKAGLVPGDAIVAVDDHELQDEGDSSIGTLQTAISKHKSGEPVRVRLLNPSGETKEIDLTRP